MRAPRGYRRNGSSPNQGIDTHRPIIFYHHTWLVEISVAQLRALTHGFFLHMPTSGEKMREKRVVGI